MVTEDVIICISIILLWQYYKNQWIHCFEQTCSYDSNDALYSKIV